MPRICLGGVSEVSLRCLGGILEVSGNISEASRTADPPPWKCLGGVCLGTVSEVSRVAAPQSRLFVGDTKAARSGAAGAGGVAGGEGGELAADRLSKMASGNLG